MWILPKNHPLYSAYAPEYLGSKEDWKELSKNSDGSDRQLPLMWKSKPLYVRTWLLLWRRVFWIQHLSGRTLKPSIHNRFVKEYTSTLGVIRANHSALPESNQVRAIQDTFGRIYNSTLKQLDLFSDSSKMSEGTSNWDSMRFTEAFQIWVTQLSQEYSQRKRLVRHIKEKDFSFSQSEKTIWPTPTANPDNRQQKEDWEWMGNYYKKPDGTKIQTDLNHSVRRWATPTVQDSDNLAGPSQFKRNSHPLNTQIHSTDGQHDQESNSMNGNNREQLNPAWVAQLMGTTLERTFFVPMVIQSWSKQLSTHS